VIAEELWYELDAIQEFVADAALEPAAVAYWGMKAVFEGIQR
jgi:hypothetical protein